MTVTQIFTVLAGVLALAGAYLYFFGIDPETKRALEKKALQTMGENKMSYLAKDQINKIPASDQEDVKNLKKTLGNAVGSVTNNPLGEQAVRAANAAYDTAASYSKSAGEVVQAYSKSAIESASAYGNKAKEVVVEKVEHVEKAKKAE